MDGSPVSFKGGINGYAGSTSYLDTNNNRIFNFLLQQNAAPLKSAFKISINNYRTFPGDPQTDLDSSIFVSNRTYGANLLFAPLAAGITWYDSTGVAYNSVPASPNSFSIDSIEDLEYNSIKYRKASITFECFLVFNFTDTIRLTNGEATVLFSVGQ